MKIDIDKLSAAELEKLSLKIEKRKEDLAQEKLQNALKDIQAVAKKHDVALEDVLALIPGKPSKRKVQKGKPKYRNPEDATQTWTGMGRKPQWLVDCLDAGKSLEDLAI